MFSFCGSFLGLYVLISACGPYDLFPLWRRSGGSNVASPSPSPSPSESVRDKYKSLCKFKIMMLGTWQVQVQVQVQAKAFVTSTRVYANSRLWCWGVSCCLVGCSVIPVRVKVILYPYLITLLFELDPSLDWRLWQVQVQVSRFQDKFLSGE